jgi:hypothetical protein
MKLFGSAVFGLLYDYCSDKVVCTFYYDFTVNSKLTLVVARKALNFRCVMTATSSHIVNCECPQTRNCCSAGELGPPYIPPKRFILVTPNGDLIAEKCTSMLNTKIHTNGPGVPSVLVHKLLAVNREPFKSA